MNAVETLAPPPPASETKIKKPRGFAAISPERRAEIARLGGQASHAAGTAHKFTKAEAAAAGRKGGLAKRANANAEG